MPSIKYLCAYLFKASYVIMAVKLLGEERFGHDFRTCYELMRLFKYS